MLLLLAGKKMRAVPNCSQRSSASTTNFVFTSCGEDGHVLFSPGEDAPVLQREVDHLDRSNKDAGLIKARPTPQNLFPTFQAPVYLELEDFAEYWGIDMGHASILMLDYFSPGKSHGSLQKLQWRIMASREL